MGKTGFLRNSVQKSKAIDAIMSLSRETDNNHLSQSCDSECKKHVPVVNKNCYVMTGKIWRGEVLFHSKLWRWESKEKSIEKRESGREGSSQRKWSFIPDGDRERSMSSCPVLFCLPTGCTVEGPWEKGEMAFNGRDLRVSYVQIRPCTCGLRKGQTGRIRRCRGYLN